MGFAEILAYNLVLGMAFCLIAHLALLVGGSEARWGAVGGALFGAGWTERYPGPY